MRWNNWITGNILYLIFKKTLWCPESLMPAGSSMCSWYCIWSDQGC